MISSTTLPASALAMVPDENERNADIRMQRLASERFAINDL